MRVTLFANVLPSFNPYIALLQRSIQPYCDAPVDLRPRFELDWVWRQARPGDIAHLHWIESHLRPVPWFGKEAVSWRRLVNRLGENRLTYPARATGLLGQLAWALSQARRAGVRLVYTVHNLAPHDARPNYLGRLAERANRLILAQADAVHVHSRAAALALQRAYGRTHNVFVVPHGNYLGWYANTLSRAEARRSLALPEAAFVYLFLGQIAPYKGLEELLAAFSQLADPATYLVIAGKVVRPEYLDHLGARVTQPRVVFRPGFVPDEALQLYLNAADIVVNPYQQITTSGSVMLALSFGRPVLAPAFETLAEVIAPAAGLLYPVGEPGALAGALREARTRNWSSAAVLAEAHRFDWPELGQRLVQVYRAALGETAAGGEAPP